MDKHGNKNDDIYHYYGDYDLSPFFEEDRTGSNSKIQVSDEYTWAGSDASNVNAQLLEFSAFFLTQVGTLYTNSGSPYSILVKYINGYSDSGTLTYSYTASVAI